MTDLPTGDLLREIARVQRDKTLMEVRDIIDRLKTDVYDERTYTMKPRSAITFREELLAEIRGLQT